MALAVRPPRPAKGLRASALRLAAEALDANVGTGVPFYDTARDAQVTALPTFPDFARRLSRLKRPRTLYGADAANRLALAWAYSLPRFGPAPDAWNVFWTELTRTTWSYFEIANLHSFRSDEDVIEFDEGLTIRVRRFEALAGLLGWDRDRIDASLGDDWFRSFSPGSHVLILSEEVPKGPDNLVLAGTGTGWPLIQRLLLAMRLAAPGDVRIGTLYHGRREGIHLIGGLGSSALGGRTGPGDQYNLTTDRLVDVRNLYARIRDFYQLHAVRLASITIALERFSATFDRSWLSRADRLIDDMIALEAIVGTRDELAFRIAFRVSGMLEGDDDKRMALFKGLKSFYDTRSKVVHGSALNVKATEDLAREPELRGVVQRLLRGILGLIATEFDPTPKFVTSRLDELLLIPEERQRLVAAMTTMGSRLRSR